MLGLWCLFQAFKGLFVPLPTVAASVGRLSGVFAFCFFLPFQGWPWLLPGSGVCLCPSLPCCVPLHLVCLCVVCCCSSNAKRIPNPAPLRRSLLCLLCRLVLFSPPPLASCFLPLPCCCCCFPSLVVFGSFPVVLFAGVGWSFRHLHGHPSFN